MDILDKQYKNVEDGVSSPEEKRKTSEEAIQRVGVTEEEARDRVRWK